MGITQRQEQILNSLIREYINLAEPISSEFLERKHNFGVCPATIRAELQKLTEKGYLYQPHASSGRIPTNKGYRFFVDGLLENGIEENFFSEDFSEFSEIENDEIFKFIEDITRRLARFSSNLALTYLLDKDLLWKDGWSSVFESPEFQKREYLVDFMKTVERLEKDIKKLAEENLSEINIFIGREKSFLNSKDFSLIVSRGKFPNRKQGFLAILGPKRMAYDKNINLIHSLVERLEKL